MGDSLYIYRVPQKKIALAPKCNIGPYAAPTASNWLNKAENGLNMAGHIQEGFVRIMLTPQKLALGGPQECPKRVFFCSKRTIFGQNMRKWSKTVTATSNTLNKVTNGFKMAGHTQSGTLGSFNPPHLSSGDVRGAPKLNF